jgi:hypothetical protein
MLGKLMPKRKKTITKHDMIRSINILNAKVDYVDNAVTSMSEMFREFVTFMEFEDQFFDYLDAKFKEEDGKSE